MLKRLLAAGLLLSAVGLAGGANAAYHSSSSGTMMGTAKAPAMMKSSPMMAPWKKIRTAKGRVWAGSRGMVLYTFDKDTAGKSNCYGMCAVEWPPFRAAPGSQATGAWTLVARVGFAKQWALNGKPLYFWFKDTKPGDATGDGIDGFHLAR